MPLLTKLITYLLKKNGIEQMKAQEKDESIDFRPVVKLYTPDAQAVWLLTEILPKESDIAFGLCDLGLQSPELGYVSLLELQSIRGRLGLPIERDRYFKAEKPLSEYLAQAQTAGRIVT
ncbi:MAG: DUF2958 domain-containing protein [Bacteroidota bacterium]